MRIRTGLLITTAGVASLIGSQPLAQGQSATGPSRHAPSTQPHHPAGGWDGPPMLMGGGRGRQGGQGFRGGPFGEGPGFGRGEDRTHGGEGARGGEAGHAGSTDDATAIAELTKQVRALTEQVKELRKAIAGATEEERGDDDRGHRGGRSLGRDSEERSSDRREEHRWGRDNDDDRPSGRREDHRQHRDEDDDDDRGRDRFAPPPHGSDHLSWHHDGRDRD